MFDFLSVYQRPREDWHSMEFPLQLLKELPTPHIVYYDVAMKRYAITSEDNYDILIRMKGIKIIARTSGLETVEFGNLYKHFPGLT